MQPTGGDPPLDPASAEPMLQQLATSDHAVLPPHQRPDCRITLALIPRLVT
jgi:hypothetical protein